MKTAQSFRNSGFYDYIGQKQKDILDKIIANYASFTANDFPLILWLVKKLCEFPQKADITKNARKNFVARANPVLSDTHELMHNIWIKKLGNRAALLKNFEGVCKCGKKLKFPAIEPIGVKTNSARIKRLCEREYKEACEYAQTFNDEETVRPFLEVYKKIFGNDTDKKEEEGKNDCHSKRLWHAKSMGVEYCQLCGRSKQQIIANGEILEAHHLIPLSEGGPDDPKNILVLCSWCHRDVHLRREFVKSGIDGVERAYLFFRLGKLEKN